MVKKLSSFLRRWSTRLFGVSVMPGWPAATCLRIVWLMISAHHLSKDATSLLVCHDRLDVVGCRVNKRIWCCVHWMGDVVMCHGLRHVVSATCIWCAKAGGEFELRGTETSTTWWVRMSVSCLTNILPQPTQCFTNRWLNFLPINKNTCIKCTTHILKQRYDEFNV